MAALLSKLKSPLAVVSTEEEVEMQPVTVVCFSDTHGRHRDVFVPEGDILIHAGDFTHFGKIEDAKDFNEWLGDQPHTYKIVVNGNHESNSEWIDCISTVLSNAIHLCQNSVTVKVNNTNVTLFGTQFKWPMKEANPYYNEVQACDILICHGPVEGMVDGGYGCPMLRDTVERVRPRLVVSGHIHKAYGQCTGMGGIKFVNAANAGLHHSKMEHPAVFLKLMLPVAKLEGNCEGGNGAQASEN